MFRVKHLVHWVGSFIAFAFLLGIGSLGASQVQAMQGSSGGLVLDVYPANNEVPYACVGKTIQGLFIVDAGFKEPSLSDPLAPLVSTQVQVWTTPPLVGRLSKDSWTIKSGSGSKSFTYTPTKTGEEHLIFHAMTLASPNALVMKNIDFKVVNCQFTITVHGEFHNRQGGIDSNIFYDGEGSLSLVQNDKGSAWTIKGRGTTKLQEYVDGTEGDVTCTTSSPGNGAGSFYVSGDAVPNVRLNPEFRFTDILTSVGLTCTDKGKGRTMANNIPLTGWLVNSAENGMLWDLEFSPQGESKELPISAVNDVRWTNGGNTGSMKITIMPEGGK